MAFNFVDKVTGAVKTLLNPKEKGELYAREIKDNYNARTGDALTHAQKSYRSGYLDARKDNARAFKHNWKKKYGAEYPNKPKKTRKRV